MPIEISEISITMHVTDGPAGSSGGGAGQGESDNDTTPGHETVVQDCVRRVLEILRAERER